jgi:hypothetical protein
MTLSSSGTQTAVIGTEHFVANIVTDGVYVFVVDIAAMLAGDTLELRGYSNILSGGTSRVVYMESFQDAPSPDDMIQISIPLPLDQVGGFTIKQTSGVGRAYPWKVLSL